MDNSGLSKLRCAGLGASSSLSVTSIPDTSMSGRVESDGEASTAGEGILGGRLRPDSVRSNFKKKKKEVTETEKTCVVVWEMVENSVLT